MASVKQAALVAAAPVVIQGLAQAEAAAEEANRKYYDARGQKARAEKALSDGMARRKAMLDSAKSGEVVSASQVAEVEGAIRTAEATVMLIGEALPALLKAIEEAEAAVMHAACQPKVAEITAAAQRLRDAEEAYRKAAKEKSEAWQANEVLSRWDMRWAGSAEVAKHAPASIARRDRLEATMKADQRAAIEKQRIEQEAADWEARGRKARDEQRAFYRIRGLPLPAHLAEAS